MASARRFQNDPNNFIEVGTASAVFRHTENTHVADVFLDDNLIALKLNATNVVTVAPTAVNCLQPLAMNSQKITGLAAGTANGDVLRYEQVIGQYLGTDASISDLAAATADLNLGGYTVTNLAAPSNSSDAATKGYVDSQSPATDYSIVFSQVVLTADQTPTNNQLIQFDTINLNNGTLMYDDDNYYFNIATAARYKFSVDLLYKYTNYLGNQAQVQLVRDPAGSEGTPGPFVVDYFNVPLQQVNFDSLDASLFHYELIVDVASDKQYAIRVNTITDAPVILAGSKFCCEKY